ncbi:hypothetical protein [Achromobacter animicus]|uniref:hypothetical protein n=1 Tax=Achromobacter animicus TaxID=1389935 RepID=UPI001582A522|nr:hypothetical protein [Achromobacter animicus]
MQPLLRLGTGYGAASATDTYKPMTIIEYALKDADVNALMSRSFSRVYGNPTRLSLRILACLKTMKRRTGSLARDSIPGGSVSIFVFEALEA